LAATWAFLEEGIEGFVSIKQWNCSLSVSGSCAFALNRQFTLIASLLIWLNRFLFISKVFLWLWLSPCALCYCLPLSLFLPSPLNLTTLSIMNHFHHRWLV